MSRLWGLINSMQIIVMMPLISVEFPANVQLVYYFLSYNMNFQIIPLDLNAYGILEFNETADVSFTAQFGQQGYTSLHMLQNITVIFVIAGVRLVVLITLHLQM
jgi:hypothetical protein